jgi:GT2 family glycosyltransferase
MTAYQRSEQLRKTLESIREQTVQPDQIILVEDGVNFDSQQTKQYCLDLGAEYYQRVNRPSSLDACSSIPINIGIRRATGEVLVLQCSECKYEEKDGLERLTAPVILDQYVTTNPRVQCLNKDGSFNLWFIHERENPRFLNFCQALRTSWAIKIGGFDERYQGFGWEDNDFEERLRVQGVVQKRVETLVSHQWHAPARAGTEWHNKELYDRMYGSIELGEKPIANEGKTWGSLLS